MRVLLYIDNLGAGGAQRQLAGLASLLSADGYDVMILVYHDWPFYVNVLADRVRYQCVEDNGNIIKRLRNLRRIIKIFEPSTIVSYMHVPNCCACCMKLFGGFKGRLVVSERSLTRKTTIATKLKFILYRFADSVVSNSYSQMEYIRANHQAIINKCTTVTNFVDLDKFSPSTTTTNTNTIIVVASIYELKNPKRLIQAASELKQRGYEFTINWFGVTSKEAAYYLECKKMIEDLGLSGSFHFKDKTMHIAEEYKCARFFCLPSLFEGTSNALCEAMSSGLPVICGAISDNPRYVVEGKTGFLFDPRDVDSMVTALSKALSINEEEYRRYSINCRSVAESNWASDVFLNNYKRLIGD